MAQARLAKAISFFLITNSEEVNMPRKKKSTETPKSTRPSFHENLRGFDIKVNSFGEMESTFEIDRINEFLNKAVHDKKLETADEPDSKTAKPAKKKNKAESKDEEE